jgi:superfamily II DNA/RNA helicase
MSVPLVVPVVPVAGVETLSFLELGTPAAVVEVLAAGGVDAPFPIQAATLIDAFAGRDVLGKGRTGSGKTLAFAIPTVARLAGRRAKPGAPLALILAPTRELATQIAGVIKPLAAAMNLRTTTIFGGVPAGAQLRALRAGVDIVVACPGRLLDHHGTGALRLSAVEVVVVDEADHMADQGFLPMLRRILAATPDQAQQLWFSATLDNGVDQMVRAHMRNPATHSVADADSAQAGGETVHHVVRCHEDDRVDVVAALAASAPRCVVFCRTKSRAKRLCRQLCSIGVSAVELHGNLAQNARTRNLAAFTNGTAPVLVATDIAARGIHVDDVALVVHADPPVEPKAYVHRSGRTGRAGAEGVVITVVTPELTDDARSLMRRAGVSPIEHGAVTAKNVVAAIADPMARPAPEAPAGPGRSSAGRSGAPRSGTGRSGAGSPRSGSGRSNSGSTGTNPKSAQANRRRNSSDGSRRGSTGSGQRSSAPRPG